MITFSKPTGTGTVTKRTFIGASHNSHNKTDGHSGVICSLRINSDTQTLCHPFLRSPQKQRKVSHSSYCAEILAAGRGSDRGYHSKMILGTLFSKCLVQHHFMIDSESSFVTIITVHHLEDYLLLKIVAKMNDFVSI